MEQISRTSLAGVLAGYLALAVDAEWPRPATVLPPPGGPTLWRRSEFLLRDHGYRTHPLL